MQAILPVLKGLGFSSVGLRFVKRMRVIHFVHVKKQTLNPLGSVVSELIIFTKSSSFIVVLHRGHCGMVVTFFQYLRSRFDSQSLQL